MAQRAWVLDMYMDGNRRAWLSGLCSTARCCFRCHFIVQKTEWESEKEREWERDNNNNGNFSYDIFGFCALRGHSTAKSTKDARLHLSSTAGGGATMGWKDRMVRKTLAARFWWASCLAAKKHVQPSWNCVGTNAFQFFPRLQASSKISSIHLTIVF